MHVKATMMTENNVAALLHESCEDSPVVAEDQATKSRRFSHHYLSGPVSPVKSAPPLVMWNGFGASDQTAGAPGVGSEETLPKKIKPQSNMLQSLKGLPEYEEKQEQQPDERSAGSEPYTLGGHYFHTKASIITAKGLIDLEQVVVDGKSPISFLPWSIAITLGLVMFSGKEVSVSAADCDLRTTQYCQTLVRVSGIESRISPAVISELPSIILGRDWIRMVNLVCDSANQRYFIPVPVVIETTEKKVLLTYNKEAPEPESPQLHTSIDEESEYIIYDCTSESDEGSLCVEQPDSLKVATSSTGLSSPSDLSMETSDSDLSFISSSEPFSRGILTNDGESIYSPDDTIPEGSDATSEVSHDVHESSPPEDNSVGDVR